MSFAHSNLVVRAQLSFGLLVALLFADFLRQFFHKYNFIDPGTGVHTQTVERMWGSAKWRNKRHRGTARHHLESYLSEFIWRQHQLKENRDCFESMLNSISAHFPPRSD